ncbi:MAG TPA: DPP IV N-terminal domain-containing protein [Gemmatimonadaceae bacterium]|nr:DPP IV N-terminal domain-containing protein [Gemmatimonadaceae bacterium]
MDVIAHRGRASLLVALLASLSVSAFAQRGGQASDRLQAMPGYARYTEMAPKLGASIVSGAIQPTWAADSKTFEYNFTGRRFRFDVATAKATDIGPATTAGGPGRGGFGGGGGRGGCNVPVERGRQCPNALSPDGTKRAVYKDNNLWLGDAQGNNLVAITTEGNGAKRIKYGTGSWVYGEELGQVTAMWWSPDGTKLGYYRFDESPVRDYYLQMNQTQVHDSLDVEAYPKAGAGNPIVEMYIYDLNTKTSTKLDIRDGKPFENSVVGYYAYDVSWTADSKEMLVHRTNRRQQILEFVACDPATGKCRVVFREEWPTGWVENSPPKRWLADNKRFILNSERSGFANYYMYDVSGRLINPITKGAFEVIGISALNEQANTMFYTARDGDNFMKTQLHRVKLDGTGDVRLTDPAFTHTATLSPDQKYFVDVYQKHNEPPATRVVDATNGKVVAELTKSDLTQFEALKLRKAEMYTYLAADGKTQLHGMITFPSNFDPSRKYPTLISIYGGPASASNSENFRGPQPLAEYGFIIVSLNSRAVPGMGKRTLDALYLKLGQTEMDDFALGIKALWDRPYFDKNRVGMFGTSYGGYTSAMMIVRHPDVVQVASSMSPVTAWDHYDTIYTERYMWIPQENIEGYRLGSAMNYAANLKGRLMLYYGTADNNVHPNNMMQFIQALNRANKSFEVQVGPDQGHTALGQNRMMEFFIENLVMSQARPAAQ